jgi:hypothetical protein
MTAQEYLSEAVNYGGIITTRGNMIADLQRIAREMCPGDPARQHAMVNVYLSGLEKT